MMAWVATAGTGGVVELPRWASAICCWCDLLLGAAESV